MKSILILILTSFSLQAFDLDDVQNYARTMYENPPIADKSIIFNPDYTDFHKAHNPSTIVSILQNTGLFRRPWPFSDFETLLERNITNRVREGLNYPHAELIAGKAGDQFVIFGPLNGQFHSFLRDLTELNHQGILNKDFTFSHPGTHMVFLGNVVDGTPYNVEILTLVLKLMDANPDQIFYLQGPNERGPQAIKRELAQRRYRNLQDDVTTFFNTLPSELLINSPTKSNAVIRLAYSENQPNKGVPPQCMATLKKTAPGKTLVCSVGNYPQTAIKANIEAEKRTISYRQHKGMMILPAEQGAMAFGLFASPNRAYKDFFNFYYDAFVILNLGPNLEKSTLSLFNQDTREQTGFKKMGIINVNTGELLFTPLKPEPGENQYFPTKKMQENLSLCAEKHPQVTKKTLEPIMLGCTLDLSRGLSIQGKNIRQGISIRVKEINLTGGINGRPVEVVFMDDEYSPEKARTNVETFMKKYKSTLFLCPTGSPTTESFLDLIKDGKIFVFFPVTGAPIFRKPDLNYIVHWRVSYTTEAIGLTKYVIEKHRIKDLAFFYQHDSYGMGAIVGSRAVLKKDHITKYLEVSYERNTTEFKSQIAKIKSADVGGVGFFSTEIATTEFIRQAGVDFFINRTSFALSDMAEQSFKKFAHSQGLDIIIAVFAPNPDTSNIEIVRDYRQALYKIGQVEKDVFALEGYIGASICFEILKKASPDFSNNSVRKVVEGIKNFDYKGLTFTFNPKTHELLNLLWLDLGQGEWILQPTEGL